MEKAKFPMEVLNISQGYDEGTHKGSYALDLSGKDQNIDLVFAPFTSIVKEIDKKNGNYIWIESLEEVQCANGEITKLTVMLGHCDNIDSIKIGSIIKQNEKFYSEGRSGIATGNHCHLELAKGTFAGKWYKNKYGIWQLYNSVKPNEYLFIDDNTVIKNDHGYNWNKESKISLEYLNLSPDADTWRVYELYKLPIKGNEKGFLKPKKFGGLSYIIKEKNGDLAVIKTRDFGEVKIYIGDDVSNLFSITEKPLYGVVDNV